MNVLSRSNLLTAVAEAMMQVKGYIYNVLKNKGMKANQTIFRLSYILLIFSPQPSRNPWPSNIIFVNCQNLATLGQEIKQIFNW